MKSAILTLRAFSIFAILITAFAHSMEENNQYTIAKKQYGHIIIYPKIFNPNQAFKADEFSASSKAVWKYIFSNNLKFKDLLQCNQVCKTFRNNTQDAINNAPYEIITTKHLIALARRVNNGSHFIQATYVAQRIMQGDKRYEPTDAWRADCLIPHNIWRAVCLFEALFKSGYIPACEVASQVIENAMQQKDTHIQFRALDICHSLINLPYAQAFDMAIEAANKGMHSNNNNVKNYALAVFKYLLQNNYTVAYEPAMFAAKEGVTIDHNCAPGVAVAIFELLFQHSYAPAFDVARQVANQKSEKDSIGTWCAKKKLLEKLEARKKNILF
jgi:hypothetical protein